MPLTPKGTKILSAMKQQYGEKKGEEVFYASKNAGSITGVDAVTRDQAGITQSFKPEPQDLIGKIPTETNGGGYGPKPKSPEMAPTVAPQTGTIGNTVVGSKEEPKERTVIPKVGDAAGEDGLATEAVNAATSGINTVAEAGEQAVGDDGTISTPTSASPAAGTSTSSTSAIPSLDRRLKVGDSNPVGDQSLSNWNARNRSYWKV